MFDRGCGLQRWEELKFCCGRGWVSWVLRFCCVKSIWASTSPVKMKESFMSHGSHTGMSAQLLLPRKCTIGPQPAMCLAIAEGPTGSVSFVSQEVGNRTRVSLSRWLKLLTFKCSSSGSIFLPCTLTSTGQWFSKLAPRPPEAAASPGSWWKCKSSGPF